MILADTSVWIEHFRYGQTKLARYLLDGLVLMHPYVSGELACGNLRDRKSTLADLNALPVSELASDADVLELIENRKLWGRGLGWIDMHLLASAILSECQLWTFDKKLEQVAHDLGLS